MAYAIALSPYLALFALTWAQSTESDCQALNATKPSLYHRGSCYVLGDSAVEPQPAAESCTDLPNGHLAIVTEKELLEIMTARWTFAYAWISLFHETGTSFTDGANWWWKIDEDRKWIAPREATPWRTAEVFESHFGTIEFSTKRIGDSPGGTGHPICQYKGKRTLFKPRLLNKRAPDVQKISEFFDITIHKCGMSCHDLIVCCHFAFNRDTGHCILQYQCVDDITFDDAQGYQVIEKVK